jgi:hypothetical protein
MGFLDDIKKGADNLSTSINSSVNDNQTKGRVTNLLRDLGSLTWAARTGQSGPDDAHEIARIEAELTDIVATKGALDLSIKTAPAPPPPPPAAATPPPPPAGAASPPPPPASPFPLDPDAPGVHSPADASTFPVDPDAPAPPPPAAAAPPPPAPNPPVPNPPAAPPAPAPAAEKQSDASFTLDDL